MTDRTPKPCHHPKANHQHGSYVTYVADKCRCFPCSEANRIRGARQRRQKAYGQALIVDAAPAREHLRKLRELGLSIATIEELSGASHCTIQRLAYTDRDKIRPATLDRLLAVPLEALPVDQQPAGRFIPSIGARRRVQALCTIGWSLTVIGKRSGLDKRTMHEIQWREQCTVATHLKIVATYDALWDKQPPSATSGERGSAAKARRHARLNGWVPPMAWANIDDPTSVPDLGSTDYDPYAAFIEDATHLWELGVEPQEILRRTSTTASAGAGRFRKLQPDHPLVGEFNRIAKRKTRAA